MNNPNTNGAPAPQSPRFTPRVRSFRYSRDCKPCQPIDLVRSRLKKVTDNDNGFTACCPAHCDDNPSLAVSEGEGGKVLLHCHAGCTSQDVLRGMGLSWSDLYGDTVPAWHRPHKEPVRRVAGQKTPRPAATPAANGRLAEQTATPHLVAAQGATKNWGKLAAKYEQSISKDQRFRLAASLHVDTTSLVSLHVGWNEKAGAYTFPEFNGEGHLCGISYRYLDGKKKMATGSKRGVYLPAGWSNTDGPIVIVEGASDTATGITINLATIGRPSATGGVKELVLLLSQVPADREIIVLGELDAKSSGRWPGKEGAEHVSQELANALDRPIYWSLPPDGHKDLREWHTNEKERIPANPRADLLLAIERVRHEVLPQHQQRQIEFIDSQTFAQAEYKIEWLVNRILVTGQPAVLGGSKKTLKTTLLADLAVSLGTGHPFLNQFAVPKPVRVGFISGESGQAVLQETYRRIRHAKFAGIPNPTKEVLVWWGFELPQLTRDDDLAMLEKRIRENGLQVLILDPLYLSLLAGSTDKQASNLYDIGPLLANVSQACLEAGATPILAHHTRKGVAGNYQEPELEDLAFAGVQEFSRQWILVGRRERYEPGTGEHKLWLNVGGSAGFSGCWAVDVSEGIVDGDFGSRRWDLKVRTAKDERVDVAKQKESNKETKEHKKHEERCQKLLEVLSHCPEGDTINALKEAAGMGRAATSMALNAMVQDGRVVAVTLEKSAGASGTRSQQGFKLTMPTDNNGTED